MGTSRAQKQTEIEALKERFSNDETVVVTHYSGLTVKEMGELRAGLREEGATFKVTKNTLAKIALKGTKFEQISDMFTGPTGVASSKDPVAAAKAAHKFAKENDKLIILGGAFGDTILDVKGVEALAKMPSLDEVRANIAGLIMAPASNIASLVAAPASKVASAVQAAGEKAQ